MNLLWTIFLAVLLPLGQTQAPAPSETQAIYNAAADSADHKLQHIQDNAKLEHPDQTPTVLTEREINSYIAAGRVQLPKGVKQVTFSGENQVINAVARVDFDQITAGKRASNPLLSLFSGVHDVQVVAQAEGGGGVGQVHVQSVAIDGMGVPRIALQYFVDHYLHPKYPEVGLDSRFQMPARVDTATVGDHVLTLTQK